MRSGDDLFGFRLVRAVQVRRCRRHVRGEDVVHAVWVPRPVHGHARRLDEPRRGWLGNSGIDQGLRGRHVDLAGEVRARVASGRDDRGQVHDDRRANRGHKRIQRSGIGQVGPSDVEPVPVGEPVAAPEPVLAAEPSGLLVIGLDVEVGGHHIMATGEQGADQFGTHQAESSCDEYAIS